MLRYHVTRWMREHSLQLLYSKHISEKKGIIMSKKTVVLWSIWVSLLSSIFNYIYACLPLNQILAHGNGAPWVLFVSMAVFFSGGFGTKDIVKTACSMTMGMIWAQVDFLLMMIPGFSALGGFLAILVGTAITMIIHIQYIPTLPVSVVPFIFAGGCLSFGCAGPLYAGAGQSVLGLFVTFMIACACLWLCAFGQEKLMKKYPLEES